MKKIVLSSLLLSPWTVIFSHSYHFLHLQHEQNQIVYKLTADEVEYQGNFCSTPSPTHLGWYTWQITQYIQNEESDKQI